MRPIRVLLVDDDALTRDSVAELLAAFGMQTASVSNARAALKLCDGPHKFDLVLSDVVMPDINGVQLANMLRDQHPSVPVILMTGRDSVLEGAIECGAVPLYKPFTALQLKAVIDDALEGAAGDD